MLFKLKMHGKFGKINPSLVSLEESNRMALQKQIDDLFMFTMKGKWNDVVEIYRAIPEAQKAKITKSGETALHIAVSVGQTDIAVELVEMVEEDILSIVNVRGNTALHIAASLGDLRVCRSIASRDLNLMKIRNNNGEIPLFLAAVFGKKETLLYLNTLCTESDHVRRNNGDTILHAAIAGEYFSKFALTTSHPLFIGL